MLITHKNRIRKILYAKNYRSPIASTLISCKFDRKKAILSVELFSNSQTIENHFSSESNPTNPETVATPTFSPSGGHYSSPQTITISTSTANTYTWVNAQNYCNTLNLGGKTWRLPNINELYSLVHKKKTSLPLIDETYFPNNLGLVHWSSTTSLYNSSYAVGVSFLFGNVTTWAPKLGTMVDPMVRCVSGP